MAGDVLKIIFLDFETGFFLDGHFVIKNIFISDGFVLVIDRKKAETPQIPYNMLNNLNKPNIPSLFPQFFFIPLKLDPKLPKLRIRDVPVLLPDSLQVHSQ